MGIWPCVAPFDSLFGAGTLIGLLPTTLAGGGDGGRGGGGRVAGGCGPIGAEGGLTEGAATPAADHDTGEHGWSACGHVGCDWKFMRCECLQARTPGSDLPWSMACCCSGASRRRRQGKDFAHLLRHAPWARQQPL